MREVASLANVSVGLVSQFLSGQKRVSEATEARIREAVRTLRYIPNAGVRVMQGQRSKSIALLIPDSLNPFILEVSRGVEDVALAQGLMVVTCNTDGLPEREAAFVSVLAEMRITGAVAMAMTEDEESMSHLEQSGASVVLIGAHSPRFRSVQTDNVAGGRLAMEHLLSKGHDRFVFFGGPGAGPQIEERFESARATLANKAPSVSWERHDADGNDNRTRLAAAHRILDNHRDARFAVFCANDLLALALESAALRRSIAVPERLSIVGYDDIEAAESAVVPLTTINHSGRELGRLAASAALGQPANSATLPAPFLVVRNST
jgi:LacI family transcriptional regulator